LTNEAAESWAGREVDILKRYFKTWPKEKIAEKLGRTPSAIQAKALKLGLKR
jgi:hypothetical protein